MRDGKQEIHQRKGETKNDKTEYAFFMKEKDLVPSEKHFTERGETVANMV